MLWFNVLILKIAVSLNAQKSDSIHLINYNIQLKYGFKHGYSKF